MPTFWRVFIINCWILSKVSSTSIEIIIWFLSFDLLICIDFFKQTNDNKQQVLHWLICVYWIILAFLGHINFDYGVWPFNVLLDSLIYYFVKIFVSMFIRELGLSFSLLFFFLISLGLVQSDCGFLEWVREYVSLCNIWKSLRKITVSSSLTVC